MLNPNGKLFFWGIIGSVPQSKGGAGGLGTEVEKIPEFGLLFPFVVPRLPARRRIPISCGAPSNAPGLNASDCAVSEVEKGFKSNPRLGLCGPALTSFVGVVNASGAAGAVVAFLFSRGC
jgi:hypothetical protein